MELETLINTLYQAPWEDAIEACDSINEQYTQEALPIFLDLLKNEHLDKKNLAAIGIMGLNNPEAKVYLFESLKYNFEDKATILFALSHFDCSDYMIELISWGINASFTHKHHIILALQNCDNLNPIITQKLYHLISILNTEDISEANLAYLLRLKSLLNEKPKYSIH